MQNQNKDFDSRAITARLDALLNVLLSLPGSDGKTLPTSKKVAILSSSGLRNVEIAKILGISQVNVAVVIDRLRGRRNHRRSRQ
jgi:hypothetical protein